MGYELIGDRNPWEFEDVEAFGYNVGDIITQFMPGMKDDYEEEGGDDFQTPQYKTIEVVNIYFVPKYNHTVIVLNETYYFDSDLTDWAFDRPWVQGGRIEKGNASSSIGQMFHEADLSLTGLESEIANTFQQGFNLDSTPTVTVNTATQEL